MSNANQLTLFKDERLTGRTRIDKSVVPFLEHLKSIGKSDNTIKSFRSDMNLVSEFLGADTSLETISTDRLNQFLTWLEFGRGIPCSRKSYARRVTTLKVFFKWLHDEKIIPTDPADKLVQRSGPAPLQPVLNADEIRQLLKMGERLRIEGRKPDTRPLLLAILLVQTGIKKSETVALEREHIERDAEQPMLVVSYKRQNVFKERRLPISPEWIELLDEYLVQYKPKHNRIFDCTARNLEYVLTDLAKLSGVETKVSFETLRWTYAVQRYMSGMDMDDLRDSMGLSEISWRETSQKIVKIATDLQTAHA